MELGLTKSNPLQTWSDAIQSQQWDLLGGDRSTPVNSGLDQGEMKPTMSQWLSNQGNECQNAASHQVILGTVEGLGLDISEQLQEFPSGSPTTSDVCGR